MKLRQIRTDEDDPMIGRTLDGRWVIEEKIGEGGMGSVYKGSQRSVNRTIAIKTLRANLTDNDEFVDRFFREAKIATTINHPHCVTVLDFGQDPETQELYLAMEFLDGLPLADRIDEGSMSISDVIKISIQVASALAASHANSIIHRDLKPDNIFLVDMATGDVFSKVLDFGIAKVADDENQYTRTGQIFGTPDYMSPEQCGGQQLDGRSDLYSLGCILYEITTGNTPFAADNPMAILMAHMAEIPKTPSSLGIELPPGLELIIMRLLAKEADERYEHANALIFALKEVQEQLAGAQAYHKSQGIRIAPAMTSPAGGFERVQTPLPPMQDPAMVRLGLSATASMEIEQTSWETPPTNKKPLIILGGLVLVGIIAASVVVSVLTMGADPIAPKPVVTAGSTLKPKQSPPLEVKTKKAVVTPTEEEPTLNPEPTTPDSELVFENPTEEDVSSEEKPKSNTRRKRTKPKPAVVVKDNPPTEPPPTEEPKPANTKNDHDAVQAALDGLGKPSKGKSEPIKKPATKPPAGIIDDLGL